jgi:hypothetical protein
MCKDQKMEFGFSAITDNGYSTTGRQSHLWYLIIITHIKYMVVWGLGLYYGGTDYIVNS